MDFIIATLVIGFCTSIIVGTLVYCILKKKHDEDIEWLFNMICTNKTEVNRFYNKYCDHIVEYHESEGKDSL
jgi:hypothetical protein